ncbi:uncharacterized protein LOC143316750 isoform X2 [Chaetodon auriga]|uniref:uncharacterized protein LOC143316750 isoform X2 n=1 Tax=Chaetodon auriga TaxID=39042 RepID=UPI004032B316
MRRAPGGRFAAGVGGLCPGQLEASSPGRSEGEIWRRLSENGILFNFCQSRREEDNSQTGMPADGPIKPKFVACFLKGEDFSTQMSNIPSDVTGERRHDQDTRTMHEPDGKRELRSSGCCNLHCSISCTDRDATYTSLTGRGR